MDCPIGNFRGDDLVDIINVNRPSNSDNIEILRAELQVGNLPPFVEENPVFPYKVSIWRDQSIYLNPSNQIYLRIYFFNEKHQREVRETCIGSLTLKTNPQVVKDTKQQGV